MKRNRIVRIDLNFRTDEIRFWRASYPYMHAIKMTPRGVDRVRTCTCYWVEESFDRLKRFTKR